MKSKVLLNECPLGGDLASSGTIETFLREGFNTDEFGTESCNQFESMWQSQGSHIDLDWHLAPFFDYEHAHFGLIGFDCKNRRIVYFDSQALVSPKTGTSNKAFLAQNLKNKFGSLARVFTVYVKYAHNLNGILYLSSLSLDTFFLCISFRSEHYMR